MKNLGFSVDTHLLRELGELLVGRDSTAILELVKNGYDADASVVTIDAQYLGDPQASEITVSDDGNGMTYTRFEEAFLRIAGRDKEEGPRRSDRFGRSYTGQKGIGRLASQKLAGVLEVKSQPRVSAKNSIESAVAAQIDWDAIDKQDTLDDLHDGLDVQQVPLSSSLPFGTTMTLRRLKGEWSNSDVAKFVLELKSAQPPVFLTEDTAEKLRLSSEPLFGRPVLRDATDENDPGFNIEFTGDLDAGSDLWLQAAQDFLWCVEIEVHDGRARYRITPTKSQCEAQPLSRPFYFERAASPQLSFQARFFTLINASTRRGPLKGFVRSNSGIRVYQEGFRVLPYGEYGDDWLGTDRDYRTGARYYTIDLDQEASDELEIDKREALSAVASTGYFGAIFLTSRGAPGLQSLINREGFVPGEVFNEIRDLTRSGVQLSVRVRRYVDGQAQELKRQLDVESAADDGNTEGPTNESDVETPAPTSPPNGNAPRVVARPPRSTYGLLSTQQASERERQSATAARAALSELGTFAAQPSAEQFRAVAAGYEAVSATLSRLQAIQPELRTLAGVGLQLGAFVHDINGMLGTAATVRSLLGRFIDDSADSRQRSQLAKISGAVDELAHVLARESSYLTDVLTADPRRRRSRVAISQRVDPVLRFLSPQIAANNQTVVLDIGDDAKTPPMFPAEMSIILTNLLTNAIKNAGQGGEILIAAESRAIGEVSIVISNTGNAIVVEDSEQWFVPFNSTTTEVDETLGQGLGLGLPIVRAVVDDYRGEVRFVPPEGKYATSIQVWLKEN